MSNRSFPVWTLGVLITVLCFNLTYGQKGAELRMFE